MVGFGRFLVGFEEGGRRRTFPKVEEGRFGRFWRIFWYVLMRVGGFGRFLVGFGRFFMYLSEQGKGK